MYPFLESVFMELEQYLTSRAGGGNGVHVRKISDIIQGGQLSLSELIHAKKRKEIDMDSFAIELERERAVLIRQLSDCKELNSDSTIEHVNAAVDQIKKLLKI